MKTVYWKYNCHFDGCISQTRVIQCVQNRFFHLLFHCYILAKSTSNICPKQRVTEHVSSPLFMIIWSPKIFQLLSFLSHMTTSYWIAHTPVFHPIAPLPPIRCWLADLHKGFQTPPKTLTLKMATAMFAKTLENPQYSTRFISKSRSLGKLTCAVHGPNNRCIQYFHFKSTNKEIIWDLNPF
jgi:hypothetical protein